MRSKGGRAQAWSALAAVAGLCVAAALEAAPAPWYVWRSKLNGAEHCAQASPGYGWARDRGPFRDLHCTWPVDDSSRIRGNFPGKSGSEQMKAEPSRKPVTPAHE